VIEEAPLKASKSSDMRSYLPVTISGRTPFSLKGNKKRLLEFLLKFPETKLQDFSYTTTARTMHETLKATYVAESVPTLIQKMTDDNSDSADRKESTTAPKVAFVFTGMSAQYSGMGAELFKTNTRFRKSILSMQKVCDHQSLPSFVEIISDPTLDVDNKTTTQVQLAIVALELALADLWRSWGIEPAFVIGHSLGEYAALCVAGVLSVSEALGLVGMRAALMEEMLAPGDFAMLAIASDSIDVSKQLAHLNLTGCSIACLNAPFSTVISGPTREIEELKLHCRSEGKRSTLLRVQFGFHSSQFDPILAEFVARAKVIQFAQPKIPVASTLLGAIVCEAGVFGAEYLAQQARNSVRFIDAVNACVVEGLADAATVWLEVGPDRVCLNFVKEIVEAQNLLTSLKRTEPNWKTMALSAAALYKAHVPILWAEYHKEYVDCLSLLELPTYTFDEKSFWTTYRHDLPATSDQAVLAPIHVPNLSMSLHSVEEESITKESITVKFVSRLADPELFTAVHGHNIEDAALCPGSVFCDMAFTAATYVQSKKGQGKELAMDIKNLTMEHPIVVPETTASNCIKVTAVMNAESQEKLNIAFSHSFQSSSQDTGHCQIVFSDLERRREELMISSFFVKARMDSVISTVTNGSGHRLQKPIIYKLFSNVVKYSSQYQAIDELFWDENAGEAVAKVTLQKHTGTNESHYSPYWLDCMIHLAGFILNTNITAPDDYVYICKAVRSMRIVEKLSTHKQYQSYVRRHKDQQKGLSYSDVYFFDQEELVAVCYGLQFQRLPRTAFARILQQSKSMSSGQELVDGNIDVTRTALSSHAKNFESNRRLSTTVQSPRPGLVSLAPPAPADVDEGQAMSNIILKVVAEETGVKLDDFRPSTEFAEVGVDSLLGIAIIERVRKFTGIQLGANFFMENKTVNDARKLFQKPSETQESQPSTQTTPSTQSSNANSTMTSTTPYSSAASEVSLDELDALERSGYRKKSVEFTSNAVLIHGNPAQHQTSVFLVTDGAGSATAYLHLPRFSSGLPTYALESPFVRCPQQYSHTVEETAAIYIASIRKIQPHGPYVIGGWSAGAVHAYEISRQLLASGETIRSLVIIDMHIPRPMPDGREVTPEFIEKIGVATGINRSRSSLAPAAMTELKQHLLHTIQSLASYKPLPMASDRRPWKSMVIWAGKSLSEVFDEDELQGATDIGLKGEVEGNVMQDPEMDLCAWFFSKRYKFGPNGWDDLLGPVECHTVEADHFSIVQRPAVSGIPPFSS
jgi:iterative type I PKS product template protein